MLKAVLAVPFDVLAPRPQLGIVRQRQGLAVIDGVIVRPDTVELIRDTHHDFIGLNVIKRDIAVREHLIDVAAQHDAILCALESVIVERLNVISSSENSSNENNLLNAASINEETDNNDLYDPETNIKIGTSYLAYLIELYDGNIVLALTAYNAGLGNVEKWIKDGIIKADGSDIENIPYKETENYVRKILSSYQMYLKIY